MTIFFPEKHKLGWISVLILSFVFLISYGLKTEIPTTQSNQDYEQRIASSLISQINSFKKYPGMGKIVLKSEVQTPFCPDLDQYAVIYFNQCKMVFPLEKLAGGNVRGKGRLLKIVFLNDAQIVLSQDRSSQYTAGIVENFKKKFQPINFPPKVRQKLQEELTIGLNFKSNYEVLQQCLRTDFSRVETSGMSIHELVRVLFLMGIKKIFFSTEDAISIFLIRTPYVQGYLQGDLSKEGSGQLQLFYQKYELYGIIRTKMGRYSAEKPDTKFFFNSILSIMPHQSQTPAEDMITEAHRMLSLKNGRYAHLIPLYLQLAAQYSLNETQKADLEDLRLEAGMIMLKHLQEAKDDELRMRAACYWGVNPDVKVLPFLVAGLKDPNPRVRTHMVLALGRYSQEIAKTNELLQPLLEMTRDADTSIRVASLESVINYCPSSEDVPACFSVLKQCMQDENPRVRETTLVVVEDWGRQFQDVSQIIPLLILGLKDQVEDVRERALLAIENLENCNKNISTALPEIRKLLKDKNTRIREHAEQIYSRIREDGGHSPPYKN